MSVPDACPLHGLILAGGRSRRMQEDKALLRYSDRPQVAVAYELVHQLVSPAFVSCRAGQWHDPVVNELPQLHDTLADIGPLGGILRAFEHAPDAAWLILACDLPYLTRPTLQTLIERRDPTRMATAFRAPDSGLPEPMCAIYEPAIADRLHDYLSKDVRCPRKILLSEDTLLLDLPDTQALTNVNHPGEYDKILDTLDRSKIHTVTIRYFAAFRDQAGCSEETVRTPATTVLDLYREVQARHGLSLPPDRIGVAVNDEFSELAHTLAAGDTIDLMPPVCGG